MTREVARSSALPVGSAIVIQEGKEYILISHTSKGFFAFAARCPVDKFKVRLNGSQFSCVKCEFDLDGNPLIGPSKEKNAKLERVGKVLEINGLIYFQN